MPILVAAVAVVGGLCLLDLLLTFGVIRRLREHTQMLTGARGSEPPPIGLAAGKPPGLFSAETTSGEEVTGAAGLQVIAFFSSWCSTCPERVPPFLEYLSRHRIGRDSVLAVVAADSSTPAPYLEQLAEVALACVEPTGGEIATAFEVQGFPAFFLLDPDGAVAVNGYDPAALPEPAAV
jgi:thiol-disulfide isomerase/thioredoxin